MQIQSRQRPTLQYRKELGPSRITATHRSALHELRKVPNERSDQREGEAKADRK
jgi:hypothetical protein